jgi:hypothetical protein
MGGFLTKSDHMFLINKMKTNRNNNPTIVHEVQSDFVCLKENFGINSKMFRGDASIKHFEISKGDATKYKCEYDKWSPNESMR